MFKRIIRTVFRSLKSIQDWAENEGTNQTSRAGLIINEDKNALAGVNLTLNRGMTPHKVINIWDYLTFREGTQAHHISKVLDFEEWVTMDEILRRVNELFGARYQNERSLYPYLKTMVDAGLLEASMLGGKMRWRKKSLLHTIQLLEEETEVVSPLQRTE